MDKWAYTAGHLLGVLHVLDRTYYLPKDAKEYVQKQIIEAENVLNSKSEDHGNNQMDAKS